MSRKKVIIIIVVRVDVNREILHFMESDGRLLKVINRLIRVVDIIKGTTDGLKKFAAFSNLNNLIDWAESEDRRRVSHI